MNDGKNELLTLYGEKSSDTLNFTCFVEYLTILQKLKHVKSLFDHIFFSKFLVMKAFRRRTTNQITKIISAITSKINT